MTRRAREMSRCSAKRVAATTRFALAVMMTSIGSGCGKSPGTAADAAVMDARTPVDAVPSVYGKRT